MIEAKATSYFGTMHIPKFGGEIWYVSKSGHDTNNNGRHPDSAFLTIGAGLSEMASGDALNVKAGTYDENGLDLGSGGAKHAVELWGEIGTLINNSSAGTCLAISGNSSLVRGVKASEANEVGFAITGNGCFFDHCISEDNSIAFDIDGCCNVFQFCQDRNATITGFDIANYENLLYLCESMASGGASRGFYLSNAAADRNMLYQCLSQGNGTAGYEIVSEAQYNAIAYCISGGKDGPKVDDGANNVWSNFSFENILAKLQTLVGSGSPVTVSTNLFQIYGTVEIEYIHGHVMTQLGADIDNVYFDVYDGTNSVPLTKTTDLDLDAAPVGSLLHKTADADEVLTYEQSDQVRLYEDDTKFGVDRTFVLNAKNGVNNYVRMTYTTTDTPTSGAIHWHIEWRPMSDDGYVKAI